MSVHVYVIVHGDGDRPCKIGRSASPFERMQALQSGTPIALRLACSFPFSSPRKAAAIEHAAHSALSGKVISREWFDVAHTEAAQVIENAIAGVVYQDDESSAKPRAAWAEKLWKYNGSNVFMRMRASTGWTQGQLAEALNVRRSAISNYEAGQLPRRDVVQRFILLARQHGQEYTFQDVWAEPSAA